jgi:hypothetical protein
MVAIQQNELFIIIAAIVVIGLIGVFMLRRRGKEGRISNVKFLAKEAELKKIKIVEKNLESQYRMSDVILPSRLQEKLINLRENNTDLTHKVGYLNNEINAMSNRLETQTESIKLQKLLMDIEKKKNKLQKITGKVKGENKL